MTVDHPVLGTGQVLLAEVICRDKGNSLATIPFAGQLPDEIRILPDGMRLEHADKGLMDVVAYQVAFGDKLWYMKREDLLSAVRLYY